MNFLKKYLGDPELIQHLDYTKADKYEFDLDGQKLEFLSPDEPKYHPFTIAPREVNLGEKFWKTEHSTTGPYQCLFVTSWDVYNQKLFNKSRAGSIRFSCVLSHRPNQTSMHSLKDLYQHTAHTISEHYRILGGGMINRVEGFWTHEVTYSQKESDFYLLNHNNINWLCGYKLSEGFVENSFYQTLLNEDVVIKLKFSRKIGNGNTTHAMKPAIIEAMNVAERDFIRYFSLGEKPETAAVQQMLADQYQGKILTLDDIGKSAETTLLKAE